MAWAAKTPQVRSSGSTQCELCQINIVDLRPINNVEAAQIVGPTNATVVVRNFELPSVVKRPGSSESISLVSVEQSAWASAGQMATRFEIAKAIGGGNAGLFRPEGDQPQAQDRTAFPLLATPLYYRVIEPTLSAPTRAALALAGSPQEWNAFLLSAPELMFR